MTIETDMELAIKVSSICASKGYSLDGQIAIRMLDTGVFELTYSLDYPPARVHQGGVVFPKGSPQELIWGIITGG